MKNEKWWDGVCAGWRDAGTRRRKFFGVDEVRGILWAGETLVPCSLGREQGLVRSCLVCLTRTSEELS
jgi:hypothetical protein